MDTSPTISQPLECNKEFQVQMPQFTSRELHLWAWVSCQCLSLCSHGISLSTAQDGLSSCKDSYTQTSHSLYIGASPGHTQVLGDEGICDTIIIRQSLTLRFISPAGLTAQPSQTPQTAGWPRPSQSPASPTPNQE